MERKWKDEIENIQRKQVQEVVLENEKSNLIFKKVGDSVYRVFNKKTNRFHDLELGIDMVV